MGERPCLAALLLCAGLAACGTGGGGGPQPPGPEVSGKGYGTFAGLGPHIEEQMAEEAAARMGGAYPPAQYLLDFQQRVNDGDRFGRLFIGLLQRDGYYVRQWHDPSMAPQCGQPQPRKERAGGPQPMPVCYLVDEVSGMLRLTLYAGGESWSRLYSEEQRRLRPVGAWSQQRGY